MLRFVPVTLLSLVLVLPGCGLLGSSDAGGELDPTADAIARAAVGTHRSEAHVARNAYRHPVETLGFFGLEPDMTVLEILPGGLWYTEIIAPVLAEDGRYIAAAYDLSLPDQPDYNTFNNESLGL